MNRIKLWVRRWHPRNYRWRIASLINRLPRTCWVDLVDWAMDGHRGAIERADDWRGAIPTTSNRKCGPGTVDFDRNGSCYCGKLMTPELRAQVDAAAARQAAS